MGDARPRAYAGAVFNLTAHRCAGSLMLPVEATSGAPDEPGVCGVCGTRMKLGYGGRLPVHDTPTPEPPPRRA